MLQSWGNYPSIAPSHVIDMHWRDQQLPFEQYAADFLAYGQGRSYGDSCLSQDGILITTRHLNRLIRFDPLSGVLECEAGTLLKDILAFSVPQGWFLPVLPGTKYVSVGGAIANDIHGKNHSQMGTFGQHVISFDLLRSTDGQISCSPNNNSALYHATIGGLGLTGIILTAKLQLRRVNGHFLNMEQYRFNQLDELFTLIADNKHTFEYSVAWLDSANQGKKLGRGILICANHASNSPLKIKLSPSAQLKIPRYFPGNLIRPSIIRAYNNAYYSRHTRKSSYVHYEKFFFPLDNIQCWNRLYGKRGLVQYQCVLPMQVDKLHALLKTITNSGQTASLAVLKVFDNIASPGMLSFPMPGITLALDFAFRGEKTLQLLSTLDALIIKYQGRVYPAKDARMSADAFKHFFPQWQAFSHYIDPKFSSAFWHRVMHDNA